LDAAAAACVPVAFGTAQECLFAAVHLEAGQTVLIHAGAGGVGMAAIQLAKHAGATVISTASIQSQSWTSSALRRSRLVSVPADSPNIT
jgi:NADPH:quinone reductase-like Zn-dependent oxidoreductase